MSEWNRRPLGLLIFLAVAWCLGALWLVGGASRTGAASEYPVATLGLDALLGNKGRQQHVVKLATSSIHGQVYDWPTYVRWGQALYATGHVMEPPTGENRAALLGGNVRCACCHQNQREKGSHAVSAAGAGFFDLEKRLWKESAPPSLPPIPASRTNFWGVVNRAEMADSSPTFSTAAKPNRKERNSSRLVEGIQTCCRERGQGRLAEVWECDALMAYFWELEIRLSDLQLPRAVEQDVLAVLGRDGLADAAEIEAMRSLLRRLAMLAATSPP